MFSFAKVLEFLRRRAAQPAASRREESELANAGYRDPQGVRREREKQDRLWQQVRPGHGRLLAQETIRGLAALAGPCPLRGVAARKRRDGGRLADEVDVGLDRNGLHQQARHQQRDEGPRPRPILGILHCAAPSFADACYIIS